MSRDGFSVDVCCDEVAGLGDVCRVGDFGRRKQPSTRREKTMTETAAAWGLDAPIRVSYLAMLLGSAHLE